MGMAYANDNISDMEVYKGTVSWTAWRDGGVDGVKVA